MRPALVLGLLLAIGASASAGEPSAERGKRAPSPLECVSAALRDSRHAAPSEAHVFTQRIRDLGPDALSPALSILNARQVPPVAADDAPQMLSEPQRDMLLGAIASWPIEDSLRAVEASLEGGACFAPVHAALNVWGAVGGPQHLERACQLAGESIDSTYRREAMQKALQKAVRQMLVRRTDAHEVLLDSYRKLPRELRLSFVLGVGAARDARSSEFFASAIENDPEFAPAMLAQVQLIERSHDPEVLERLAAVTRPYLGSESRTTLNVALRALGALRDQESVPAMIEALESEDAGVRESAEWALQRATQLNWRGASAWRSWYESEMAWFESRIDAVLNGLDSNSTKQQSAALLEAAKHPLFAARLAPWAAEALRSSSPLVRAAACDALARLDSPLAFEALIEALLDESDEVAAQAHRALATLSRLDLAPDPEAWRTALLM